MSSDEPAPKGIRGSVSITRRYSAVPGDSELPPWVQAAKARWPTVVFGEPTIGHEAPSSFALTSNLDGIGLIATTDHSISVGAVRNTGPDRHVTTMIVEGVEVDLLGFGATADEFAAAAGAIGT